MRIRLSTLQRKKALALLHKNSKKQTILELRKRYHPGLTLKQVEQTYYSKGGPFTIKLTGNSTRQEVIDTMRKFEKHRQRTKRMHENPEHQKAQKERSSRVMTRLRKNPEFIKALQRGMLLNSQDLRQRTASSKRLKEQNKDPEFVKKRLAGFTKNFEKHRGEIERKTSELGIIYAWERSKKDGTLQRITATTNNPATIAQNRERRQIIKKALEKLTKQQQTIIDLTFGITTTEKTTSQIAKQTRLTKTQVKQQLKQALTKLAQNQLLKEI
jgi:RNA polymerase sigma factor (sigma-70 family)